ncbi:MAG TPA: hypothetical protein DCY15_09595 [Ruminococcaceae bacterium]|nr:hypothetical protein [Oscillospiraceae bacterium]
MKKNVFRGILAVVLAAAVVFFTVGVGAATTHYKRGTYEGSGRGKFSDVVLSVKIRRGKITAIDVISQNETPNYWKRAVAVIDRIIESNNTAVDGVTGATKSSNAIKTAVNNALKQATVYGDISFLTPDFLKNIIDIFVRELTFIKVVCS